MNILLSKTQISRFVTWTEANAYRKYPLLIDQFSLIKKERSCHFISILSSNCLIDKMILHYIQQRLALTKHKTESCKI